MYVIVLTGGIATGKSTALRFLLGQGGDSIACYDCDAEVAGILSSGILAPDLIRLFGSLSVKADGSTDKEYLRKIVFNDVACRKQLEGLIHPVLQQECLAKIRSARQNHTVRGFIVDVPLYYETGFSCGEDAVCVIAVSAGTQRKRLAMRNHFDDELIRSMMASQLPIMDKVKQADNVLWNEGPVGVLEQQVERFFRHYFS